MWSTTGWADTTITISVDASTGTACTCAFWPRCICAQFGASIIPDPPLRIKRHDWWNLYQRDLRDEILLLPTAPAAVRIARRLQPGNLHERRVQKHKRHVQQLRAQ